MEALNALCRSICTQTPDLDTAWEELDRTAHSRPYFTLWQELCAYILVTFSFCLFFGGTTLDALCAGACGLAVGMSLRFMSRLGTNLFFKTMVGGFFCGLIAMTLTWLGVGTHIDLIIIGSIMAQAPGLVITNFMRDILAGDMVSGITKLAEALLTGAGIAVGTGVALGLARGFLGVL